MNNQFGFFHPLFRLWSLLCRPLFSSIGWLLCCFLCAPPLIKAVEIPLEFHGGGGISKYINSRSARYNLDVVADIYCAVIRYRGLSYYLNYRDELDMGLQTGGVTFDPRNVHYAIITGADYCWPNWFGRFYFMHDCYHDIDRLVDGTPVFNRFRFQVGHRDFHYARAAAPRARFAAALTTGLYPHLSYHGWDINAGADFNYDIIIEGLAVLYRQAGLAINFQPKFHFTRGDSIWYHQHLLRLLVYYQTHGRRIGISLDYHLYNNDPIKSPDKLWLYSIYIEF